MTAQLASLPTPSSPADEAATPRLRTDKALHLIDLDNMVGGVDIMTRERVLDVFRAYSALIQPGDDVVAAVDQRRLKVARHALDSYGVRTLPGFGQDGADNTLLAEAVRDLMGGRKTRWLVVASGDRAFAPLVRIAKRFGKRTWLVNGAGQCSYELRNITDVHSTLRHARAAAEAARQAPVALRPAS